MKETYTISATVQTEVRVEANDIEEAIQIVKDDLRFGSLPSWITFKHCWPEYAGLGFDQRHFPKELQDHVQINAVRKEGK